MSDTGVDKGRRNLLVGLTVGVGGVGAGFAAWPFLSSWQPSAKAQAAGAPVEVDLNKIEEGQMVKVQWRGKPVLVVKRSSEMLSRLDDASINLTDPDSADPLQQPTYAVNEFRSIRPEVLVLVGICTHLGCAPLFRPEVTAEMKSGGFFCPCHGSKFDLSGRVYAGVPAPTNLLVPPYSFSSDSTVLIGVDPTGEAA